MADNVTLNPGSLGEKIATDDDGTAHHQYVKLEFGADNTQTKVQDSSPLPVKVEGFDAENAVALNNPVQIGGRYDSPARTLDSGDVGAIAVDSNGYIIISGQSTGITIDGLVSVIGTVTANARMHTDAMINGSTVLTPKFASIDAATSGDNTIVAAVAGKKIRVLQLVLVATGDVVARFESGASGTALTGQMDLTANSGVTMNFSPVGWFETAVSTLLNLELDGAVSVDGCLTYVEI